MYFIYIIQFIYNKYIITEKIPTHITMNWDKIMKKINKIIKLNKARKTSYISITELPI